MNPYRDDEHTRRQLIRIMRRLVDSGMTGGRSGNVSVRIDGGLLITPTGMLPENLEPEHVVAMSVDGSAPEGQLKPSSEWRMHADLYRHRADISAAVHCHSHYATVLACARKPIPAQHYMVAAAGGYEIPLAEYATFGTEELSRSALRAMKSVKACLLANHGQLVAGVDLEEAFALAELVEEQARWYWGTLCIGGGHVLERQQMDEVIARFSTYGQQDE